MVVIPITSTSGELNAARMAMASSEQISKLEIHCEGCPQTRALMLHRCGDDDDSASKLPLTLTYSRISVDDQLFARHQHTDNSALAMCAHSRYRRAFGFSGRCSHLRKRKTSQMCG